jgi:hypothetical protein
VRLDAGVHDRGHVGFDAHVGGNELGTSTKLLFDLLPELGFAIAEHDRRAMSDEQLGDGLADASGSSSDDRDLAVER